MLRSDLGSTTAELAISLPAVLLVLGIGLGLIHLQITRIELVGEVFALARQAARGDQIPGSYVSGKLVCVSRTKLSMSEKACSRKLGL